MLPAHQLVSSHLDFEGLIDMMGHSHATTGAAAWVAVTATVPGAMGLMPLTPAEIAAGALVTAGAALLPDADHHSGTIAWSLPPVSKWITRAVGDISGGHRHATHSLLGVAIAGLGAWGLSFLRLPIAGEDFQAGAWLMVLLLVAFAAKALRLTRGWITSWTFALVGATAAVWYAPEAMWWLPVSVVLGCLVHIAGDMLTTEGCPVLWPFNPKPMVETAVWKNNGYFALPLLGNAGSGREWVFIVGVNLYVVWVLAHTIAPDQVGSLMALAGV